MKSVLISIQPKWVEKIANGEKTIEVRTTRPKIETPFKVNIYQSKKFVQAEIGEANKYRPFLRQNQGKVIGEFVCDKVYELFPFGMGTGIELLDELVSPEMFCKESCLTEQEICDYIGEKDGYGWNISDLKIYDKPKELSEFKVECPTKNLINGDCNFCKYTNFSFYGNRPKCNAYLTRPPQSWCYVADLNDEN